MLNPLNNTGTWRRSDRKLLLQPELAVAVRFLHRSTSVSGLRQTATHADLAIRETVVLQTQFALALAMPTPQTVAVTVQLLPSVVPNTTAILQVTNSGYYPQQSGVVTSLTSGGTAGSLVDTNSDGYPDSFVFSLGIPSFTPLQSPYRHSIPWYCILYFVFLRLSSHTVHFKLSVIAKAIDVAANTAGRSTTATATVDYQVGSSQMAVNFTVVEPPSSCKPHLFSPRSPPRQEIPSTQQCRRPSTLPLLKFLLINVSAAGALLPHTIFSWLSRWTHLGSPQNLIVHSPFQHRLSCGCWAILIEHIS